MRAFDHALEAQPGRERQALERTGRRFTRVEGHKTEIARLQDQPERPNRLFEGPLVHVAEEPRVGDDVPADPEQPFELDPGAGCRLDIQHVERVDQRDELAPRRGRSHHRDEQAAAA